ncbi:MAG: hypothetical protein KJ072_07995 [Verrucomicrobia bacterium]|nr:hypothetical protein [Verrucomicrobiota bacterium]
MFIEFASAARFRPLRQGIAAIALAVSAGLFAGCGRDEVTVYEAPKDVPPPRATTGTDPHTHAQTDPHQGMAMPATLKWETPAGWQAQPAGGMRLANYLVPAGSQTGQVSVVVLPQVVGRDLEVLNIFRERLRVPPLEPDQLNGLAQQIPIGSEAGHVYDMSGEGEGDAADRLLVAVLQDGQASYYFNFFGPTGLVEAEKPNFLALLKSVTQAAESSAATPPAMPPPASPMAAASAPTDGRPRWTVPEGWRETPPTQMLLARFEAGDDNGKAEITVSMFPGDVGGTVANVNRWRGQIGLAPWSEAEVTQAMTTLEVEGGSAMVVEMFNDQPGSGKRLVGVIWPRGTHTWFYKMVGADAVVTREKAALIQFVQSVRHSNA